jgi:hypothetical protein
MIGRVESHQQSANAYHALDPNQNPSPVRLASESGESAQTNCSGCAQSIGAAMAMLSSHAQPTPSLVAHRPWTGGVPDAQAPHRKAPGRAQSQKVLGPASPGLASESLGLVDSSAADASAADPRESTAVEAPQLIEAPTTTIV